MLEILATISGLVQGVLVMLNKRSNWVFYSLQMVFLVVFSVNVKLWGDVAIDSVYFFLGIAGFILWKKDGSENSITVFSWVNRVKWLLITLIAVIATYAVLKMTDNPLPMLDSVTSVTSIVATWFMFRHKLEAWIIWLLNDLFYIAEYAMLPDQPLYLISLYIIWTVLALFSFLNWRRLLRKSVASVYSQ